MRQKYIITILFIFCIFPFFGCKLLLGSGIRTEEALEIVVKGENFTLVWDPGSPEIPNNPNRVVGYNVFYRIHKSSKWIFLMR